MVVSPEFRVFVCNTVTGRVVRDLDVASQSWGIRLNAPGPVSAQLLPRADVYDGVDVMGLTSPIIHSLGVAYGGRILECGPIWKRGYKGGKLTLDAEGMWSMFEHRKALTGAALAAGAKVTDSKILKPNSSLGDIARELIRISLEDNPYGAGGLNIRLPDVIEGGVHNRPYYGYDLGWIGSRLKELSELEDGPDIRLRPQFQDGDPDLVEWVLEYGSAAQPLLQQAGQDWIWDAAAEGSPVVDLDTEEDATGVGVRAWVPGSGQERSMLLASATNDTLLAAGMPWLEVDEAAKDVEDKSVLQSYANRLRNEAANPWKVLGLTVRADSSPLLGEYLPGEWAQVVIPADHPTLNAGSQRFRLMALDGDGTAEVKLSVAPIQDAGGNTGSSGGGQIGSDQNGALPGTWAAELDGIWAGLPSGTWNEVS